MKVLVEYNNFDDLYKNSWSGALNTLDRIAELNKENELMDFLEMEYSVFDKTPTEAEINDFLWFMSDYIFDSLGISWEDEEEDDEDEN